MIALLPLSVLLPLLGAALSLVVSRRPSVQRAVSVVVLSAQLALDVTLLVQVDAHGPLVMHLGGWAAPVGITLVADRLAGIMMVVSTVVTLAVLVYAIGQGRANNGDRAGENTESPTVVFHPAFLILAAGVSNAFVAGDLFNLFVSFEILLTASYVLLTVGGTRERLRAGVPYVVVSLISSVIFLSAIALVYAATGTVNLADLSGRLADLPPGTAAVLQAMLLVAFGIKAAVWPMSAWLPDSYPTAPAPVTAVFAGLLTKVGIYAIIRTQTLLFPGGGFATLLMWAALATMIVGILGAVAQPGIKRLLSFTLVSHIGYMLFGLALGSQAGLGAAVFYVAHHILVQTALFLAAGLIEYLAGTTMVARLGGLAAASPLLAVLFFVPAMSLAGIPPLSGFLGKVGLFEAGFADGRPLAVVLVGGGIVTSLLTLYAIVRVWGRAFWRPIPMLEDLDPAEFQPVIGSAIDPRSATATETTVAATEPARRVRPVAVARDSGRSLARRGRAEQAARQRSTEQARVRLPRWMVIATAAVVAAGLALTIAGGPLYALADRAGADLHDPSRYVSAVLGPR